MSTTPKSVGRRGDAEARRRAQTQFERPLVLEAGAGTGKTSTLVARLLQWTLGPGWTRAGAELESIADEPGAERNAIARHVLQRVLAITFTEAAAAQMGSRVALALIGLSRADEARHPDEKRALAGFQSNLLQIEPQELQRRATALLGNLDHLAAQTFHSWCRGLLTQYPIESEVHPSFRIDADGLMTERIVDEVLESRLSDLYGDDPEAPAVRLLTEHIGAGALREQLVSLAAAGVPFAELERDRFARQSLRPLLDALRDAAGDVHELLEPELAREAATPVVLETAAIPTQVRRWCDENAPTVGASAFENALSQLAVEVPKKRLDRLRDWANSRFSNRWERDHLAGLGDEFALACGRLHGLLTDTLAQKPLRFARLSEALAPVLREIQRLRRTRGILSFDDLLDRAASLLQRHPAICAAQRSHCDQLMVDEFQDTDRRQCDLVRRIALSGSEDTRPGLFIVGDPKQSLYGWREADLAAYADFLSEIESAGGNVLSLTVNFRSVPVILDEVERVVAPIMRPVEGLQPRFEALLPSTALEESPGFSDDVRRPVEYWVNWAQDSTATSDDGASPTKAAAAAEIEFEALAADLLELRQSGIEWDSIGILMRSRSRLTDLLDSLRRAGIPYQVEGERTYFLRREIIEAAAWLRIVAQPHDRLALITALRTAWVGVPDAALMPLLEKRFDERLASLESPEDPALLSIVELVDRVADDLPKDVPGLHSIAGWEKNLIAAVKAVAELRQTLRTEPADRFVDRLRSQLLLDATEAARLLGAFRTANLDRFFHQLESALETESDLPGLLRFLRRAVEGSRLAPAAPVAQRSGSAVQVMTIHGAKGLDFDHVYLLQIGAGERPKRVELFAARRPARPDEAWGLTLHGAPGPEWPLVAANERRREAAERVRLLYVAMTRAQNRLVISGNWPPSPSRTSPESARHLQHLIENRVDLPEDLQTLRSQADPGGSIDAGGTRWRFPVSGRPASTAGMTSSSDWIPDDAQLDHLFAEQIAAGKTARERQSHPLLTRATEHAMEADRSVETSEAMLTQGNGSDGGDDDESRTLARRLGTVIHSAIESWRLDGDVERELERTRSWVDRQLERALPPEQVEAARSRAEHLLDAFSSGVIAQRWNDVLPLVEARELPILIPWIPDGVEGALTGAIDLVYRDPKNDRVILVDFKTDHLNGPGDAMTHAQRYRGQAQAYRSAIRSALALEHRPDFEFWFLDTREIVTLSDAATETGESE